MGNIETLISGIISELVERSTRVHGNVNDLLLDEGLFEVFPEAYTFQGDDFHLRDFHSYDGLEIYSVSHKGEPVYQRESYDGKLRELHLYKRGDWEDSLKELHDLIITGQLSLSFK